MTEDASFKDFFYSEDNPDKTPLAGKMVYGACFKALASPGLGGVTGLSRDKKEEFIEDVCNIAQSESFIDKLSSDLGTPKPDESEDAFVRRAKAVMKEALRSRLRKQG